MDNGKTLRPFGMRDKIGYAFGDFGCNMSFAFINSYLMLFYVTCMKINPKHFAMFGLKYSYFIVLSYSRLYNRALLFCKYITLDAINQTLSYYLLFCLLKL